MNDSPRLDFISLLRVVAIYWVVLIQHNLAPFGHTWHWINGCEPVRWILTPVFRYVTLLTMPMCFFISGFLLAYTGIIYKKSFKVYFVKKINRLLIPCITVGGVFSLVMDHGFNFHILYGGYQHLWFLWSLFFMFFVSYPLLKKISDKMLIPLIILIFCVSQIHAIVPSNLFHQNCSYYVAFLLGYSAFQFRTFIASKIHYVSLLIIAVISLIAISFSTNKSVEFLYSCIMTLAIFQLCMKNKSYIERKFKFILILDKTSYGVYIFHMVYLYIFYAILKRYFSDEVLAEYAYYYSSILSFLTIMFSIFTTKFVKRFNLLSI